jgi:hypothetical protein
MRAVGASNPMSLICMRVASGIAETGAFQYATQVVLTGTLPNAK